MANISVDSYLSYTIGIIVFFIGVEITKRVKFLRDFDIPEPVTGGLLAALVTYGFLPSQGVK